MEATLEVDSIFGKNPFKSVLIRGDHHRINAFTNPPSTGITWPVVFSIRELSNKYIASVC
jgi:hypothetical protein